MNEDLLTKLIKKYLSGEANKKEIRQIENWYESFDAHNIDFYEETASLQRSWQIVVAKIIQKEKKEEQCLQKNRNKTRYKWAAVAAAVAVILCGSYFLWNSKQPKNQIAVQQKKNDFQPGGNKAILTLSNGQQITLDSATKGLLSIQGSTRVIQLNNGQLAYNNSLKLGHRKGRKHAEGLKVLYNTISTPRGGQYKIILPDGSKVWLNAASSLRFPTAFTGSKRRVTITGEAYFEITDNAEQPFEVSVNGMRIKVLGTSFNVKAYNNASAWKTTLVKGAIKVSKGNRKLYPEPGQEVRVMKNNQMILVKNANIDKAVAWKNQLFWFDNDNIQEVIQQLSRWYDVDIQIKGTITDRFTGSIPRKYTFSRVFEILQKTGSIHYKIKNNKVLITP